MGENLVNFDCASGGEINLAREIVPEADIIYANPIKSIDDLRVAMDQKVDKVVVDSKEEVQKLVDGNFWNIDLVVRIHSDETFSQIKFNSKFGCNLHEYEEIVDVASRNDYVVRGISFHVGSRCANMMAYTNTLNTIFHNYLPINDRIDMIDIGGGFSNLLQIKELGEILKLYRNDNILYIAEPGRLFSEHTITLFVKVIGVKKKEIAGENVYMVFINDSIYHSFNGKLFDGQSFSPIPLYGSSKMVKATIFGQTCDSLDVICSNIVIPEPSINDIFMFEGMGAYSLASCYGKFNDFMPMSLLNDVAMG